MASRALSSPVAVMSGVADHTPSTPASSSSRRKRERQPPVAPPRTSSTQQHQTSQRSERERERERAERHAAAANDKFANSPGRYQDSDLNGGADLGYGSEPVSRRRKHNASTPESAGRQGASREARHGNGRTAEMPIREHAHRSSSRGIEAEPIIDRQVVSQPEVDIEREKERLYEAQPHPTTGGSAQPPLASPSDHHGEERRATRSRQDHSVKSGSGKTPKIGDYYLGNTIGEGEFGKVKLGWKQAGGVQVGVVEEFSFP